MIRVLVVDRDPDVRLAYVFLLEAMGCQAAEAANGRDALMYHEVRPVDVLVVDIDFTGGGGLDLIAAVHRLPRRPRIVAMTADVIRGAGDPLLAAGAEGADALLVKPISRDRLLAVITQLTGRTPMPHLPR